MEEYRGGTDEKVMRIRARTEKVRCEKSQLGGRTEADGKWKVSGLLSRKCSLGVQVPLDSCEVGGGHTSEPRLPRLCWYSNIHSTWVS